MEPLLPLEISVDHGLHQLSEPDFRRPAQLTKGLSGVAHQAVNFGGADEVGVDHDVVSQQERPDKKVYALTKQGREQLRTWLDTPTALNLDIRNETFLKLMLARRLKQVEPLEVLKVEKRACFAQLHEVTQARAKAKAEGEPLQTTLLLDLAVLRLEAFMKWLENCDELVREEKQP